MPFWLINASFIFLYYITIVLSDLFNSYYIVYLNNIFVFLKDRDIYMATDIPTGAPYN